MARSIYRIEISRRAERALLDLPPEASKRVAVKIDALAVEPRPREASKLAGEEHLYRLRVGDYRVIYQIRDRVLIVLVVGVGHRRDVYRR